MRALFVGIFVAALCVCGCNGPGSKVAVIDIEKIFKDYRKSRSIYEDLQKERNELETRGQEMLDELNALVKEKDILSDEARKEREVRIREKTTALESFRRGAMMNLMEKTNAEYNKLMEDVRVAAEAVAEKRHVEIIMDESTVVYRAKGLDVTEDIIAELNRRFDKTQGPQED